MNDTAERILLESLRLFAAEGYEGVSVSMIAEALGITKGALYRHYPGKRAIFDAILRRMEQQDTEEAQACGVPEGTAAKQPEKYEQTQLEELIGFSREMFRVWTQDEFSCRFRRMLTLEQFRSPEMSALYHQYLCTGPLEYTRELLAGMGVRDAQEMAQLFYGPMFMLYSVYDGAADKQRVNGLLEEHLAAMQKELEVKIHEVSKE